MEVTVQHTTGQSTVIEIGLDSVVQDVTERACRAFGVGVVGATLQHCGHAMLGETAVADTDITSGASLTLLYTGAEVKCPAEHCFGNEVDFMVISSCGKHCYVKEKNEGICVINTETGVHRAVREYETALRVAGIALSLCGGWLFIASNWGVDQLDATTGDTIRTVCEIPSTQVATTWKYVVSAHWAAREVRLHDMDGVLVKVLLHRTILRVFSVAMDGMWLVSLDDDGAHLHDLVAFRVDKVISSRRCWGVAVSPCCERFAVASNALEAGTVHSLEVRMRSGDVVWCCDDVEAGPLVWSPCSRYLFGRVEDCFQMRDAATSTVLRTITAELLVPSPCMRFLFTTTSLLEEWRLSDGLTALRVCAFDDVEDA